MMTFRDILQHMKIDTHIAIDDGAQKWWCETLLDNCSEEELDREAYIGLDGIYFEEGDREYNKSIPDYTFLYGKWNDDGEFERE